MSKTLNIIDSLNVGMCDEAGHIFNKDMTEVGILFKVEDESALFDEVHVEAGKRNNTNNFISETQTQLEKRNPEISFYHFRYEDSQDLTPDKYNNSFSEEIATLVSKSNALKNPFVSDYYIFIKMDFSKELSEQCFEELNMLTSRVEVAFPKARRLSSYEKDDVLYSEVLPFFHFLAHKCYKEYPYFDTEIIPRVIQSDIQFGTKACFVPETEESNRYETCVEFYDRDDIVEDNPLCEFVTNPAFNKISFIHRINYKLYSNKASLKLIESKDVDLQAVDSDSIKSYSELYTLKQLLQENSIVLGNMTSGLYIHGNSEEELTEKVSKIQQILSSAGFRNKQAYQVMVFGTLISMYQYKFPFSERKAIKELDYLPSDVFSALFFFNGNYRGRAINNPWYKSVVKFQTTTESIYDFNFHKQMNKND